MIKIAYQALPMAQFTTLQKRVFPMYFSIQAILGLAVALSYPPQSLKSLARHWKEAIPIVATLAMSLLNVFIVGPKTQKAMIDRIHQETRDGRKYNDLENQSAEMKTINRQFKTVHAMSIHVNLIAIIATVWYGIVLGSKLNIVE